MALRMAARLPRKYGSYSISIMQEQPGFFVHDTPDIKWFVVHPIYYRRLREFTEHELVDLLRAIDRDGHDIWICNPPDVASPMTRYLVNSMVDSIDTIHDELEHRSFSAPPLPTHRFVQYAVPVPIGMLMPPPGSSRAGDSDEESGRRHGKRRKNRRDDSDDSDEAYKSDDARGGRRGKDHVPKSRGKRDRRRCLPSPGSESSGEESQAQDARTTIGDLDFDPDSIKAPRGLFGADAKSRRDGSPKAESSRSRSKRDSSSKAESSRSRSKRDDNDKSESRKDRHSRKESTKAESSRSSHHRAESSKSRTSEIKESRADKKLSSRVAAWQETIPEGEEEKPESSRKKSSKGKERAKEDNDKHRHRRKKDEDDKDRSHKKPKPLEFDKSGRKKQ
jgi:hypothetical protein